MLKLFALKNCHAFSRQKQDQDLIEQSAVRRKTNASISKPTISCNEGEKRTREMFFLAMKLLAPICV
jgi:hypothetical protein